LQFPSSQLAALSNPDTSGGGAVTGSNALDVTTNKEIQQLRDDTAGLRQANGNLLVDVAALNSKGKLVVSRKY